MYFTFSGRELEKEKGSFGILIVFGADRHRVGIKENKLKILYNFVLEGVK